MAHTCRIGIHPRILAVLVGFVAYCSVGGVTARADVCPSPNIGPDGLDVVPATDPRVDFPCVEIADAYTGPTVAHFYAPEGWAENRAALDTEQRNIVSAWERATQRSTSAFESIFGSPVPQIMFFYINIPHPSPSGEPANASRSEVTIVNPDGSIAREFDVCSIHAFQQLYDIARTDTDEFEQTVAHEVAHCFQYFSHRERMGSVEDTGFNASSWWAEGIAEYLSSITGTYPCVNGEHRRSEYYYRLESIHRQPNHYATVAFFSFLVNSPHGDYDPAAVQQFMEAMPTTLTANAQHRALLRYLRTKPDLLHDFAKAALDGKVPGECGADEVLPTPLDDAYPKYTLDGSSFEISPFDASAFELVQITLGKGRTYRFEMSEPRGVTLSARPNGGDWGALPEEVTTPCENDVVMMLLATGVGPVRRYDSWSIEYTYEDRTEEDCEEERFTGSSAGDPHLLTFDAFDYDLQTIGEYVLSRSFDLTFEVQTRQSATPLSDHWTQNSAVAFKMGDDRIALYISDYPDPDLEELLWVNGAPAALPEDGLVFDAGRLNWRGPNTIVAKWNSGETATVTIIGTPPLRWLNVATSIPPENRGAYRGLMGNGDGDPLNDLITRAGETLTPPWGDELRQLAMDAAALLNSDSDAAIFLDDARDALEEFSLSAEEWAAMSEAEQDAMVERMDALQGEFEERGRTVFESEEVQSLMDRYTEIDRSRYANPEDQILVQRTFADTWRVLPAESLFDYPDGKSTDDFTDLSAPTKFVSIADFDAADNERAEEMCMDAGFAGPAFRACLFDVAATGEATVAPQMQDFFENVDGEYFSEQFEALQAGDAE